MRRRERREERRTWKVVDQPQNTKTSSCSRKASAHGGVQPHPAFIPIGRHHLLVLWQHTQSINRTRSLHTDTCRPPFLRTNTNITRNSPRSSCGSVYSDTRRTHTWSSVAVSTIALNMLACLIWIYMLLLSTQPLAYISRNSRCLARRRWGVGLPWVSVGLNRALRIAFGRGFVSWRWEWNPTLPLMSGVLLLMRLAYVRACLDSYSSMKLSVSLDTTVAALFR